MLPLKNYKTYDKSSVKLFSKYVVLNQFYSHKTKLKLKKPNNLK